MSMRMMSCNIYKVRIGILLPVSDRVRVFPLPCMSNVSGVLKAKRSLR